MNQFELSSLDVFFFLSLESMFFFVWRATLYATLGDACARYDDETRNALRSSAPRFQVCVSVCLCLELKTETAPRKLLLEIFLESCFGQKSIFFFLFFDLLFLFTFISGERKKGITSRRPRDGVLPCHRRHRHCNSSLSWSSSLLW